MRTDAFLGSLLATILAIIGFVIVFGKKKMVVPEKTTIGVFAVRRSDNGETHFASIELTNTSLKELQSFERYYADRMTNFYTITIINLIEVEK